MRLVCQHPSTPLCGRARGSAMCSPGYTTLHKVGGPKSRGASLVSVAAQAAWPHGGSRPMHALVSNASVRLIGGEHVPRWGESAKSAQWGGGGGSLRQEKEGHVSPT